MNIFSGLMIALAALSITSQSNTTTDVTLVEDHSYPNDCYKSDKGVYYIINDLDEEAYVYSAKATTMTIEIPDTVTYKDINLEEKSVKVTKILEDAFSGNDKVENIVGFNNIEEIEPGAFAGTNIKNINSYDSDNEGINFGENLVKIDSRAFYNCDNIESVSYEALVDVADYAFFNNDSLKTFGDENGIVKVDYETGKYVFSDCDAITTVKIDTDSINDYLFSNDLSLHEAYIVNLNAIGIGAFSNSSIEIVHSNNILSISQEAFMNTNLDTFGPVENIVNLEQILVINKDTFKNANIGNLTLGYKQYLYQNTFLENDITNLSLANYNLTFGDSGIDFETVSITTNSEVVKSDIIKNYPNANVTIKTSVNDIVINVLGRGDAYALSDSSGEETIRLVIYPEKGQNLNLELSSVENAELVFKEGEYYLTDITGKVTMQAVFSRFTSTVSACNYDKDNKTFVDPENEYTYKTYTNPTNNLVEVYLNSINNYDETVVLPDYIMYGNETYKLSKITSESFVDKEVVKVYGNNISIIDKGTFKDMTSLEEVYFKSLVNIDDDVFNNTSLKGFNKVEIIDLTNVESIGGRAFMLCNSETIEFGTIDTIGESAFLDNDNLNYIYAYDNVLGDVYDNAFTQRSTIDKYLLVGYDRTIQDYDLEDSKEDGLFFGFNIESTIGNVVIESEENSYSNVLLDLYNSKGAIIEIVPNDNYKVVDNSILVNGSSRMDESLGNNQYLISNGSSNVSISYEIEKITLISETEQSTDEIITNPTVDSMPSVIESDDVYDSSNFIIGAGVLAAALVLGAFMFIKKRKK